ncbi:hypothetical protein [Variovorax sp. PAMC28562]|uniref:hypothetical protein n=1 Tax=Variovorax sp. PAMC28562 TaxID=2762323 RepID=UPI003965AF39
MAAHKGGASAGVQCLIAYGQAIPAITATAASPTGHPALDLLSLIQWPAFAASVVAAWLVASSSKPRRNVGFWIFLLSNVLWVAWGIHTSAYALLALQFCLAAMNIRGLFKTED